MQQIWIHKFFIKFSLEGCDNKDKGPNVSKAREPIEQEDMQKLFQAYFINLKN